MNATTTTPEASSRLAVLIAPFRKLMTEVSKFGMVGIIAFVIDIGLFNLLILWNPGGFFLDRPITTKVISVVVATTASYFLNRQWTYSDRDRTGTVREYVLFFVFNGIALLISLGTLWFSHYALGLTSALADNISANVIGLGLGTLFRFWAYRTYVFPEKEEAAELGEIELDAVGEIDVAFALPRHTEAIDLPATEAGSATKLSDHSLVGAKA